MEKFTSCYKACMYHDVDVVRRALEDGFVVDSRDGCFNNTLLHVSARCGCREIVSLLLEYKADVNVQNYDGDTPLHGSAWSGHTETVSLLLANIDNVNVTNNSGNTPLHYSACCGYKEIVSMLLSKKADVNVQDERGKTPLHLSAEYGHTEIVSLLLENKADVNVKCGEGFTPIDYTDNTEVVNVLLKHGAIPDKQGRRPSYWFNIWSQTTTRSVKVTVTPGVEDNKDRSASTSHSHTQTIEIKDEVTNTIRNDETTSDPAQIYENTDQYKIPGLDTVTTMEEGQVLASAIAGDIEQAVTNRLRKFPAIKSTCTPSVSTDVSTSQQNGTTIVNINNTVIINNELNIRNIRDVKCQKAKVKGKLVSFNGIHHVYGSTRTDTDDDDSDEFDEEDED